MATCSRCQTDNPDNARICRQCGSQLPSQGLAQTGAPRAGAPSSAPSACPSCGQPASADSQFCSRCGTSIVSAACPSCGQAAAVNDQYCSRCGATLISIEIAGFWRRLGGSLIDVVIVFVLAIIPAIIVGTLAYNAMDPPEFAFTQSQQDEQETAGSVAGAAGTGIFLVIFAVYGAALNAGGGTVGKRIVGVRLEDIHTGENIGIGKSLVRFIVSIASGLAVLLGYLWCIWDSNKQTWHDKAAGSVVVRT